MISILLRVVLMIGLTGVTKNVNAAENANIAESLAASSSSGPVAVEQSFLTLIRPLPGARGEQILRFNLTQDDYFAQCSFQDILTEEKGAILLALFNYVSNNGTLEYDFAYGPLWYNFLLARMQPEIASQRPPAHPVYDYPLAGTAEYYLVERGDHHYESTFIGTQTKVTEDKAHLLSLLLKDQKSSTDLCGIGQYYCVQRDYDKAHKWFNRALVTAAVNKEPAGRVYLHILETLLIQDRWPDILSRSSEAFKRPFCASEQNEVQQEIIRIVGIAYQRLMHYHIARKESDMAIELGHECLTLLTQHEQALRIEILLVMGMLYEQEQKAPLAFYCFRRALQANPQSAGNALFHILFLFSKYKHMLATDEYQDDIHICARLFLELSRENGKQLARYLVEQNRTEDYAVALNTAETLQVIDQQKIVQETAPSAQAAPSSSSNEETSMYAQVFNAFRDTFF